MTDIVSVYAVFADGEEAARIGRQMVEEKLAACVNILAPCRSIYRWNDAIEEGKEVPAIFKTTSAQATLLMARISQLHSYDVPAVVVWPIGEAAEPYRAWVLANSNR